jgi:hypothetical protein
VDAARPARRFALAGAKADERQALLAILHDAELAALLPGQVLIGDMNYYGPRLRDRPGPGQSSRSPSKASSTSNATVDTPWLG